MTDFPGFPSNGYEFHFEQVGPALAGLIVRDTDGNPRAGLLTSKPDVVRTRTDWSLDSDPFVAVRAKGRAVLIGGTTEAGLLDITPAPAANARLDVIWTRPADVDAGEAIIPLQVTNGIPSAVPAKPGIPAGAVEVATLRVPAGAINTAGCILTLTFDSTATAGGIVPFRTTALMNIWSAVPGQFAVVSGNLYQRIGTSWRMEAGDTGWKPATLRAGFTGTVLFRMKNGHVVARGSFARTALKDDWEELCNLPADITSPVSTAEFTYVAGVPSGRTTNFRVVNSGLVSVRRSDTSAASVSVEAIQYTP